MDNQNQPHEANEIECDDARLTLEYYCTRCNATLNKQKGFDPELGYWRCAICDAHLYGDQAEANAKYPGVFWYCDKCESFLNVQEGFDDARETWLCKICGHANAISEDAMLPGFSEDFTFFADSLPDCVNEHAPERDSRNDSPTCRELPPLLNKRQIELLRSIDPEVQLDNRERSYWLALADDVSELLSAGGLDENGVPNAVGLVCQSILYLLR